MYEPRTFDEVLTHFGIKGMKWGVRRKNPSADIPPSDDAARATEIRQRLKEGGTKSLNNDELQILVSRMNLEQQYSNLTSREPNKVSTGHERVKKVLGIATTLQQVHSFVKSPLGKDIAKHLFKKK